MKRPVPFAIGVLLTALASGFAADRTNQPLASGSRITKASPAQVKAFLKQWGPVLREKGYLVGLDEMIHSEANTTVLVSKMLGALEREPKGLWIFCLKGVADPRLPTALSPADIVVVWKQAAAVVEKSFGTAPKDAEAQSLLVMAWESLAAARLQAGVELDLVRDTARQMLAANPTHGGVIYDAHSLLGRVALRQGDRPTARKELRAAGQTPGSPSLDSFGPRFTLAREILEKSDAQDREAVVAFLDDVARFWANPEKAESYQKANVLKKKQFIEAWKEQVRAGKIPADRPEAGSHWR